MQTFWLSCYACLHGYRPKRQNSKKIGDACYQVRTFFFFDFFFFLVVISYFAFGWCLLFFCQFSSLTIETFIQNKFKLLSINFFFCFLQFSGYSENDALSMILATFLVSFVFSITMCKRIWFFTVVVAFVAVSCFFFLFFSLWGVIFVIIA